jgi:ABC-2 type transport system permease protein
MNSSRPISMARALFILARLSLRRQLNQWRNVRFARKRRSFLQPATIAAPSRGGSSADAVARSATPAKSRGASIFGIFLFLMLGFNGFFLGERGLVLLSSTAQNLSDTNGNRIAVTRSTETQLKKADDALRRVRLLRDPAEREKYLGMWNRYLDGVFLNEIRRGAYSDEEESARLEHMRDVFAREGAAGFAHANAEVFGVSRSTWPVAADARFAFAGALSLTLLLWMPLVVFSSLGTNNKDLGQVEWSFEWLYTFPIPSHALFASKVLVYSFLYPLVWVFLFPFLVLVYVSAGAGWAALPMGAAGTIYIALLAGSLITILEVVMRKYFSLSHLKSFQALFTVLGYGSLLIFYACSNSTVIDNLLIREARSLPVWFVWNPFSLPLMVVVPGVSPLHLQWWVLGLMAIHLLAAGSLALAGSEWLTRDGLMKAGGPYQGVRKARAQSSRRTWLRGIPGQEMLLLARDRNLLVQVLVVPLMVPAYYLLVNTKMVSAVSGNFRHAAMLAFAVGAYSFLSSTIPILSREDKTLWYLLTFPQSLSSILAKKTAVWAILGMAYGGVALAVITHYSHHLHGQAATDVLVALYGIGLYAFIGSGIGILATNILETVKQARFRTDMIYLYMVLAAIYANAIYSTSVWAKIAQIALSTLLAVALWQKVKDFIPYILDPVERPPREVGLADGMIAALGFFALQGLIIVFLRYVSEASFNSQITIAYVLAGIIVGGAAMLILLRQGINDIWHVVGLAPGRGDHNLAPLPRSIFTGASCGLVASFGAFLYLHALNLFPQWQLWKQDAELNSFLTRGDKPLWLIGLAVVAAPIFEEFIFRGLVYRGLRRTAGPTLAVVGSAALFALVHPPIAIVPVFGLGIAAAISFEKTDLLLAPIIAHGVYNAVVMMLNKV